MATAVKETVCNNKKMLKINILLLNYNIMFIVCLLSFSFVLSSE